MKRILLLISLVVLTISLNAQTITNIQTSSPILCNGGQGQITATIDMAGVANVGYRLFSQLPNGTFTQVGGTSLQFTPSPNIVISNLFASIYRLRLYDLSTNAQIDEEDYMLTQPLPLVLDPNIGLQTVDASCFGGSDGEVTINMTGGSPPYQYTLLPNSVQTSPTFTGFSVGSYSFSVVDSNNCNYPNTISVNVDQPSAPVTYSTSAVSVACHGENTGAIFINNIQGGTPGYSFSWTGPNNYSASTEDIQNLFTGTYTLTITDANTCNYSESIFVDEPVAPLSITAVITDVGCYGESTGFIDVTTTGGTPSSTGYTFSWANDPTYTNEDYINASAGTYELTVTDDENCTVTETYIVVEPLAALSSSLLEDNVSCFGLADGSAQVSVSGGTTPYSYFWSNINSITSSTGLVSAGTYAVTIVDFNGCQLLDTASIDQPNEISATFDETPISCPGGGDGALIVNVSGGTTPYNYAWNSASTFQNSSQPNTITNIFEGNYSVSITDSNGCSGLFYDTISAPLALTNNPFIVDVNCFGETTGTITPNISGGTPPYSYSWGSPYGTNPTITNLSPGTYTLTVNDSNSCFGPGGGGQFSFNVGINSPTAIVPNLNITNITCNGLVNGTATVFPTGGISPYGFQWSNGNNTSSSLSSNLSSLDDGSYFVTITDQFGCFATQNFDITEPDAINIAFNTSTMPTCFGGFDGTVESQVTGGTIGSGYIYEWISETPVQTSQNLSNVGSGSYTLRIIDDNLCQENATYFLSQPADIIVDITTQNNPCFGQSNGTAFANVSNAVGSPTFLWSNGSQISSINNLSAGNYGLTVTDANQCIQTNFTVNSSSIISNSFSINDPLPIDVGGIATDISVSGANDGSIITTVTGGTPSALAGTPPYLYSWAGPNNYTATTPNISNLIEGTYTVTVTDANGCTSSLAFTITNPNCGLVISETLINPNCYGENAEELSWTISNGVSPFTSELYDATNGTYFYGPNSINSTVNLYDFIPPGQYVLKVTDNAACEFVSNIIIDDPDSLYVSFSTPTNVSCNGFSNGSLSANALGGTPNYSYQWSGPNGFSTPISSTFILPNLVAGNYTVLVYDQNNCSATASMPITEPTELVIDGSSSTPISCIPGADGTATVNVSGGSTPYTYSWTVPNFGLSQTTATATQLSISGTYNVVVIDANGCDVDEDVIVEDAPSVSLNPTTINPLCSSDSTGEIQAGISGGTPPFIYTWTRNGDTIQSGSFDYINQLTAGTYNLNVTDSLGCSAQTVELLNSPDLVAVSAIVNDVSINGFNDGSIDITVSGGLLPYTYQWIGPNGFTSSLEDINNLEAGQYALIVTDSNLCNGNFSYFVNEPSCAVEFDSATTFVTQPVCIDSIGLLNWSVSGGAPSPILGYPTFKTTITDALTGNPLHHVNHAESSLEFHEFFDDGSYIISTECQVSFCTDFLNITIQSPPSLSATYTTDSVSCFGGNDGAINFQGVGGNGGYIIDYGTTGNISTQLSADNYTVTLTDANNCPSVPSSFNITIHQPNQLDVTPNVVGVSCHGGSNGQIQLSVFGGTPDYTYVWTGPTGTPLSGANVSNLPFNTYFVEVNDANGCETTPQVIAITVPEPSQSLSVSITTSDATCFGFNDGTATANTTGGTPPFSFVWSDGQTTQTAVGLSAGSYECVVTDANGCFSNSIEFVGEPDEIDINLSSNDISCFGLIDGSASVNPQGGSGTGFTVLWNIATPFPPFSPYTSYNVGGIALGSYVVTVSDNSLPPSCDVSGSFIIAQPNLLQISTNVEQIVSCDGGSDGSLGVNVFGGTPPFTYNWSATFNNSLSTDSIINNLSSNTYFIDVIDSSGCAENSSIFLPSNLPINANITFNPISCFGGSDGIAYASPSGGNGTYSYTWSVTGDTTSSTSGLNATQLYVLSINDNICPQYDTVFTVPQPDSITVYATIDSVSCLGLSDGFINIDSIIGGNTPFSLIWSDANGFIGQTDTIANNLVAGSYTLTVTDSLGCIDSLNSYVISEPTELVANINISTNYNGSAITCFNDSTGELTATASGGTGSYSYIWSTGDSVAVVDSLSAGLYTVTVTDYNGCTDYVSTTLTNPDTIFFNYTLSNFNGSNISCNGFSDGQISVVITGGSGGIDFSSVTWTDNNGNLILPSNVVNDTTVIGLSAGTYFITVSDFNGCSSSSSVTLFEPAPLSNTFTTDSITCNDGSDGSAFSIVSGGTAPYTYSWSNGSDSLSAHALMANTLYQVSIQDVNGCPLLLDTVEVHEPDAIYLGTILTLPSCNGINDGGIIVDSISGGSPGYSYLWSDSIASTGTILNNLYGDVTYTCIVTDAAACVDTISVYLPQPDVLVADVTIITNYNGTDVQCFGDTNAILEASATGGSGSGTYSYSWTNGNTSSILNNVGAGLYTVFVTDTNNCSDLHTIEVFEPAPISITYTVSNYNGNNISCNNNSDGFINTNISGGNGIDSTTILWNTGQSTTFIDNLGAGVYQLTVSDINGCSDSLEVTLSEPAPLSNTFTTDSITCNGGSDGSAFSIVSGGTAPYTYSWSNGSDSLSAHALMANTLYQVSIQDVNGCPLLLDTVEVHEPDAIYLGTILTLPSCNGINDGGIIVDSISGATPGYSYLWSTGSTGTILNNLYGDVTYTCIVTDAAACVDTISVYLPQPDVLVADVTIITNYNGTDVQCFGDTNAILEASATGGSGSGTYSYSWTNGNTSSILNNVGAGLYTVFVTDTNNCSDLHTIEVFEPAPISITYTVSNYNGSDISCLDSLDGFINTNISGGNGIDSTTILWNTGQTTTFIDNLGAGVYQLTVSDINGCSDSLEVTLSDPAAISTNYSVDSVTCFGGNNGMALVNPVGGTSPYQVSWSNGSTSDTISGLNSSTLYFVQISDANNCPMAVDTIDIPQPDSLEVTYSTVTPTCFGINDGSIVITNVVGNTGPYTYLWNDSLQSTGTVLANLNSGEYICSITDANLCTENIIFYVDTVFALDVSATIISDYNGLPIRCFGDTNASILATSFGGTAPYSYTWSTGSTNDTIVNVGAGTYTVFVVDSNSCTNFKSIVINNPDSITSSISTSDYNGFEVSCDGLNDGFVSAVAVGGNGINYNSLLWNTGDTSIQVNNLPVGTYSYTIEDINGCSSTSQVTLVSPSAIILELLSDSLSCYGDDDATAYISNLQNAINPVNYSWSDGQNSATAINLSSGSYTLTIVDDNNCSITTSVDVYQPDSLISNLQITSSYNGSDVSCFGFSDAFASISSQGGIAPFLYSLDSIYFASTSNFNNLSAGNFEVITRDANGCVINSNVTINQPDPISANLQVLTNPSCNGVFNGSITSLTSGGTGLYYYTWSTPNSVSNVLNSITEGAYSVTINDDNGCVEQDTIQLDAIYSLVSNISSTQVSCVGGSDGTATVNISNGVLPYSYLWSNGSLNSTITGLAAGNYSVAVVDSNGCQISDSVMVSESDSALAFQSQTLTDLLCNSDSSGAISVTVMGGNGSFVFDWSNGDSTATISNLLANTYILNVTDALGCLISDTFVVSQPQTLVHTTTITDISCFGFNDGTANVQLSGGTQPYTNIWSGPLSYSSNASSLDSLAAGSYSLAISDANGCTIFDTLIIIEPSLLTSSVISSNPLCHNSDDGAIIVSVSGGIFPYTSQFGGLTANAVSIDSLVFLNLTTSSDTVYVYDANNCMTHHAVNIVAPSELSVYNLITSDPSCFNYSNGVASVNAIGGIQPYAYKLLDANSTLVSNTSNYSNLSSGQYVYVVTDLNSCSDDILFTINNPDEILVESINIDNVNCFGENSGSITVDISNFVGSYEIIWSPYEFNSSSETIQNVPAGQYEVVVVDESGCTKVDSFVISQNPDIEVEAVVTNSTCKSSADGQIEIIISGGVGPFSISNNDLLLSDDVFSSYIIENLPTNTYNLSIEDSYNCSSDMQVVIDFDGGYACINEPTIITPNFDGFNDEWKPIEDLDVEMEVIILNRWGQKEYRYSGNSLVFNWNGKGNWAGERELPSADYYYIIKFNNNNYSDRTGVITLIR